jgi:biopolymer transport protein ExbD
MAGRKIPAINAGSMADIAFLLLIFFLVTTTMNTDSGISILLPPYIEDVPPPPDVNKRNVLRVLVNSRDQLLVNEELMATTDLREFTKKFLTNRGSDPGLSDSPDKAIVSIKNDRGTSYEVYIAIQNELKAAYREVRDDESMKRFGMEYGKLKNDQQKEIRQVYPQRISEAEPEDLGGSK